MEICVNRAVTPDFGALAAKENRLEAAFRNVHLRLRKHAESIAFFGGGAREGGIIVQHFQVCPHPPPPPPPPPGG